MAPTLLDKRKEKKKQNQIPPKTPRPKNTYTDEKAIKTKLCFTDNFYGEF